MRGMIRFIPVILMLLAATAAGQDFNVYGFSTIDFSYLGGGARARAMGAAFTGVADDASALTWNPAGLIQVDRTQTSISGSYQMLEQSLALIYSSGSGSTFDAVTDDDKLKLRYASFVAPLRIKDHPFMTSVSFRAIQDLLQEWYSWTSFDDFFKREMTD
ncbi:MAG: hypothetical protein KAT58_11180, partial [candidate division Zixibacteria bacterium]|nr:hypothetical protein [candidate division Zixibacteria bacterium]